MAQPSPQSMSDLEDQYGNSTPSTNLYPEAYPVSNDIPSHIAECYQLSKTVMLFAMIDIFFGLFYAFFSFYYLLPLLIAIYGYYSAKKYNANGVLFYTIYQVFVNLIRLGFAINSYVLIRNDNSISDYSSYDFYIILAVLTTILGLYIARFCYKLYKAINKLSLLEKERLIMLNYPVRVIYW